MKKQVSTLFTCLIFFMTGVFLVGPYNARALDQSDVTVTMVSAPWFVQDHNQCDNVPRAAYMGFEVTNVTAGTLTGLEFTLTLPGNGYDLAGGQAGTLSEGDLAPGESYVAYYLVTFPCDLTSSGTFGLTVTDDMGGTGHYSEYFMHNEPIVSAANGGLDLSNMTGGTTTSDPLIYTAHYTFGNIKVGDQFNVQPVGNLDFEADAYQLVSAEVVSSNVNAIPVGCTDSLYFTSSVKQNGSGFYCTIRYIFQVLVPNVSTSAFGYASHWSGSEHNYNNDYGQVGATIYFPGADPTPAIHIEKFTNGVSVGAAPGPYVVPGEIVTWTYVVTNPGEAPLDGVILSDDNGTPDAGDDFSPALDNGDLDGDNFLDMDETWTFIYTDTAVSGQYSNMAFVEGTDSFDSVVTATDESYYFGSSPAIDIELHVNGIDADDPTGPELLIGSDVTFTYYITNTGNIACTNVIVIDDAGTPGTPGDDFSPAYLSGDDGNGILDVGEQWIFQEMSTAIAGQYSSRATSSATEPTSQTFSDRDNGNYIGVPPSIHVEKTTNGVDADVAPGPYVPIGGRITWLYTVSNRAGVPLSNITIIDDHSTLDPSDDFVPAYLSGDENGDGILDTGEEWVYRKRGFSINPGQYGNKVSVSGNMPNGQELQDSEFSHFWGTAASLYVECLTNGLDADFPSGPNLNVGDNVTWTYSVTNNGNVFLTDITVVDDNGTPGIPSDDFYAIYQYGDDGDDTLQIGETWVFEATGTVKSGQYGNWSTVRSLSPGGNFIYDTDKSHYFGVSTLIGIDILTNGKEVDAPAGPRVEEGDDVLWTYEVTMEGNSYLNRVSLIDDNGTPTNPDDDIIPVLVSGDENKNGCLDPEEKWVFQATGSALQGQYANRGFVSAVNLAGKRVQDMDKSYYFGIPYNDLMEYGDAPEGSIAYPDLGTYGAFPTRSDETFAAKIGHQTQDMFFGPMFDLERPDDFGAMLPSPADRHVDECFNDGDAGLITPSSYTIGEEGEIIACDEIKVPSLGKAGNSVSWGSDIDIEVHNYSDQEAFVNMLIDWNQDGQWRFDPNTQVNGMAVPEHALVNFPVPEGFSGSLSKLLPPQINLGPNTGYVWVRFSVTPEPVANDWIGDGLFLDGETEDYLLFVSPQAAVPLNGWTLIIVMVAMIMTTFLIYRKRI